MEGGATSPACPAVLFSRRNSGPPLPGVAKKGLGVGSSPQRCLPASAEVHHANQLLAVVQSSTQRREDGVVGSLLAHKMFLIRLRLFPDWIVAACPSMGVRRKGIPYHFLCFEAC